MYTKEMIENTIGKSMIFTKTFEGNSEDFSATHDATEYAKKLGLTIGSMQSDAPMGLAKDAEYVSKWRNLGSDVKHLDGAIIGKSKRNGPVTILLSYNPNI